MRNSLFTLTIKTIGCGIAMAFLVSGCSTMMDPMNVVDKSLEEGNLVPVQAIDTFDFLNAYQHHLTQPNNKLLDVDIAFERENVLAAGDSIHVQIGLATKSPVLSAINLHVLVFNPSSTSIEQQKQFHDIVGELVNLKQIMPKGSSLTIDSVNPVGINKENVQSLLVQKNNPDLVQFVKSYGRYTTAQGKNHFVLILDNIDHIGHVEKQHLVDIAELFSVQGMTLSTLAIGKNAQVSFLKTLCDKGHGKCNLITKDFNVKTWMEDEVMFLNAEKLQNVKLIVKTGEGIEIKNIESPTKVSVNNNGYSFIIPELVQGDDFVSLAELEIKANNYAESTNVLSVDVEYFDPLEKRFNKINKIGKINYVSDINETLNHENKKVMRSMLILNTQTVLKSIVPVIKEKRYYHAVAMLTNQSMKLINFATEYNDAELLRDASILVKYTDKLYNYDEKFLQTFQIWQDLTWDSRRYSENFN